MGTALKRPVLIAVAGALVVLLALVLAFLMLGGDDEAPPPPPPAEETTTTDAAPQPAPAEAPADPAPSFDVVRIDPQGNTVMAGRAAPDSEVVIRDGDQVVGRAKADARGEWVFLPEEPLAPGSRELSLEATAPDGGSKTSKDVVVLVVPERGDGPTLALRTDREGGASRLLQGGGAVGGDGRLAVDTVDYDEEGHLTVGGRADPGGIVQLYLDNAFLGRAMVGPEGFWSISPEAPVPTGQHTLRVDLVDEAGKVLARVELPFTRAEEAPSLPDGVRVVVQPGNNLWLLARKAYGQGTAYTVIYDANKGQIVDPDMIYPGQVFIVPEPGSEAARPPATGNGG